MANVFGPGRLEETGTWCVSSRLGYPMDLLEKLRAGDCRKEKSLVTPAENEDNSVELNLSLGGCFSDKRKLERASSIATNPAVSDAIDSSFQVTRLNRWSSLPVKKTSSEFLELCSSAAESAGTRELDFFGRGEAKRQRSGDLNEVSLAFSGRRNVDGMNMERSVLPNRSMAECPPVRGSSRGGERAGHGGNLMFFGEGSNSIVGSSQGSGSSGGVSSGVSDLEKIPQGTAGATGLKRPANFSADTSQLRQKGIEASNMSMPTSNMKLLMGELPYVCTKGDGPNGKKVEGFLYKYDKGEEIRIVCVCHGSFLSPAEFVKHGGGGDVEHPLRHIVVNPFPPFLG